VSFINRLPMTGAMSGDPVSARDRVYAATEIPPLRRFFSAAPGAFRTLGVPLEAGREYTWSDIHDDRPVAIIGQNFAREYWGSAGAALGKQIRSDPRGPWREVIGVVGDVRHDGLMQPAPSAVYWPLRDAALVYYVLRTPRAGTAALGEEIRTGVAEASTGLAMTDLQTMQDVQARSMSRTSFTMALLAVSGIMAFVLAVVGLYAVVSYGVSQQFREIGIRMALGASPGAVRWLFVRRALLWTFAGSAAGIGVAVALSGAIRALLFNVDPIDVPTYAGVIAGLVVSAALASYLPTRRLFTIALADALKTEQ
jgi:hypothetical protein